MIPTDLASRLRILIDSEVKALAPIGEAPADLPDLQPGQHFSARIDAPLADGNFRAMVAGRSIILSMPAGAKAGDVLELVVTSNNDKTISAKLADLAGSAPGLQPKLSPAGQLISQLLTGRHSETQGAKLNGNEPLLPAPPTKASALTPILRQAVSESGLFYEAHQAQWVEGDASLESLLREPQGRISPASPQGAPASPNSLTGESTHPATTPSTQTAQLGNNLPGGNDASARAMAQANHADADRAAGNDSTQTTHTSPLKIAEQLMPLVHQQLDTLATHQALWQGQVWPGQMMQWEIFDPEGQSQSSSEQADGGEPPPWQSTLRLQMPRLGGIEAQLIITAAGVAVRVSADSTQTARQLNDGSEALGSALEAAGVPMTGFAVQLGGTRDVGS